MDVVRTFVRVDGLKVHDVTDDMKFVTDTVTTVHVARHTRDIERFAAGITFDHADHFGLEPMFIDQATNPQADLQA